MGRNKGVVNLNILDLVMRLNKADKTDDYLITANRGKYQLIKCLRDTDEYWIIAETDTTLELCNAIVSLIVENEG